MVVSYIYTGTTAVPATFIELAVKLLLELAMGYFIGVIMNIFLFIIKYIKDFTKNLEN